MEGNRVAARLPELLRKTIVNLLDLGLAVREVARITGASARSVWRLAAIAEGAPTPLRRARRCSEGHLVKRWPCPICAALVRRAKAAEASTTMPATAPANVCHVCGGKMAVTSSPAIPELGIRVRYRRCGGCDLRTTQEVPLEHAPRRVI